VRMRVRLRKKGKVREIILNSSCSEHFTLTSVSFNKHAMWLLNNETARTSPDLTIDH